MESPLPSSSTATMLTALLNSLHSHLQTQTQLLPTLHAQLGLPPSALEEELKGLQKQLVQSVELQIDRRRQEVEHWLQKCEELEKECVRYTKALGGNIKSTGSSLGELRKEQSLPKRYDLVAEYQEKLRQVYHAKLEQLNTLTNRLHTLARTLGPDFFDPDVFGTIHTNNETDAAANQDVTPERFKKLEKELVRGKGEVHKRLNLLSSTFIQIDWLYTELGISHPTLDADALQLSTIGPFSQSVPAASNISSLDDPFISSTPTPASRVSSSTIVFHDDTTVSLEFEYQQILSRFVARMEEVDSENLPSNQSVPIGLDGVEPTPGLLTWAANLHASLEDVKQRRESHIQAMYDQLESLWKRLGVAESDMDAFVENHRGSTDETVQEYEEELERMLELKQERMSTFVESAREEIVRLWDDLLIGEEERADFAPFADDEYTEELLTIHEEEIKRLKDERRAKAPLLSAIKKYFEICEEEKELALAASDQSRLTGRGSRDPGRLLREEKMRKRVSKEKPRLEQDLLVSIPSWEEEAGLPFLVHGESFLHILMQTVTATDQENKRKQPRAGSVPPRSTTPVNSNNSYVPGTRTGVVTPAVRTSSQMSSRSVPNKRQRLGEISSSSGTPNFGTAVRAPLGTHRGGNVNGGARASSPTKIPSKISTGGGSRPATMSMVMPKPGTQHHALGHGRVPSSVIYSAGVTGVNTYSSGRSTSAGQSYAQVNVAGYASKAQNASGPVVIKKATRARRESFKPRPSMDAQMDLGISIGNTARWGEGFTVKEEDEY